MEIQLPPLALLAGGLANRLRPITETIPKAMVSIHGEPFVAHQLRLFAQKGITDVVMCLGYLGEQIEEYVADGSRFGVSVSYSYDGDTLLGTGGAVRRALPLLGDSFFIMYGDSYFDIDFASVYRAFRGSVHVSLMTVMRNRNQWDTSNVKFADGYVQVYEKNSQRTDLDCIDYGLSVFQSSAFSEFKEGQSFDLGKLQSRLAQEGKLAGFEIRQRFYEIGTPEGLARFEAYLTESRSG